MMVIESQHCITHTSLINYL